MAKKETSNEAVGLSEAVRIYKEITGRSKSRKVLAEEIRRHPHLGYWRINIHESGAPKLAGINKLRFTYFVKTRQALWGPKVSIFAISAEI